MDVLNLETNHLETRPITEILAGDYPSLRFLASVDKGDYISPMVYTDRSLNPHSLVITLEGLLTQTPFANHLKTILKALEFSYSRPVDIEFTVVLGTRIPAAER